MKDDILNIKDTVEDILMDDIRARGDDKYLIFKVFDKMGYGKIDVQRIEISIDEVDMRDMPSFESITRARRKFQAKGLYLPPKNVVRERENRRDEMNKIHDWFDRRR